jgi:hypothetical protein
MKRFRKAKVTSGGGQATEKYANDHPLDACTSSERHGTRKAALSPSKQGRLYGPEYIKGQASTRIAPAHPGFKEKCSRDRAWIKHAYLQGTELSENRLNGNTDRLDCTRGSKQQIKPKRDGDLSTKKLDQQSSETFTANRLVKKLSVVDSFVKVGGERRVPKRDKALANQTSIRGTPEEKAVTLEQHHSAQRRKGKDKSKLIDYNKVSRTPPNSASVNPRDLIQEKSSDTGRARGSMEERPAEIKATSEGIKLRREQVPVKRGQVFIERSKSDEKIHVYYNLHYPDSVNTDQPTKHSDDSSGNKIYTPISTNSENKFTGDREESDPTRDGEESDPTRDSELTRDNNERELTGDNEEPSVDQQTQQHEHVVKIHAIDPNETGSVVRNTPLCIQEHLRTESELESDDNGLKESQKSSISIANKFNQQQGIDIALTGQGNLVESDLLCVGQYEAMPVETEVEPNKKKVSVSDTVEDSAAFSKEEHPPHTVRDIDLPLPVLVSLKERAIKTGPGITDVASETTVRLVVHNSFEDVTTSKQENMKAEDQREMQPHHNEYEWDSAVSCFVDSCDAHDYEEIPDLTEMYVRMDPTTLSLQESLSSKDKESSPTGSKFHAQDQQKELVPVKKGWVTITRRKRDKNIHEYYNNIVCLPDSANTDQLSKQSYDSPPHKPHLPNVRSHGTQRNQPSTKTSKEELRRRYRHRPPPPKDPQPTSSNKEESIISPTNQDEHELDNMSMVHDYEEIDLEEFRIAMKSRDPSATSRLKSKEALRKLYKHRVPPKVPTTGINKEYTLADKDRQTEATPSSGKARQFHEHSSPVEHKSRELIHVESTLPSEKHLLDQSLSDFTNTSKGEVKNATSIIHGQQESSFIHGQLEDVPMTCTLKPLHSTAEGSSSHLLSVSDSNDDYMPLIPKRKNKKVNYDYDRIETLNIQQQMKKYTRSQQCT